MAENLLRKRGIIGNDVVFKYKWRDGGNVVDTVGYSKEFWDNGTDVIIGPTYSMTVRPALYLAAYLNYPHWSWTATHSELSDKKKFSTFARTLGSFSKLGSMFDILFTHYKWRRFAMFFKTTGWCEFGRKAIDEYMSLNNFDVAENIMFNDDVQLTASYIDDVLDRLQQRARIVLMCIGSKEREFLLRARQRGMTNGEYVFMITGSINAVRNPEPWKQQDSPENDDAYEAYKVVFEVSWASDELQKEIEFRRLLPYKMTEWPWFHNKSLDDFLAGKPNSDVSGT
ncbi:atrial natriuretic peptide receptor 3-like [Tubulanus polymorphus]|uniref:atrial natriuretic peptide receptor 3-like n=1 Tax=Tubulanus polymorphus TaxID=672921 RepID=UPI003DA4D51F